MQASVASQQVAYTRKGFVLKPTAASTTPSVSASPTTPAPATPPAASSAPKNFVERDISFMSDEIKFSGTLCLPAQNAKNLPIIVMTQGSGVQDRDETVGPNKVFQQLAQALASRGIATIRYDRRAIADRASLMAHLDPEHEVVIDAASALAFAATVPEANPHRVFMLGHSLGAELAPYIVARRLDQQPGSVRGMIMLAANGLSIDKVIERQVESEAAQGGMTADQVAALHKQWEDQFALARNPATPASQNIGIAPLMVPESYWRDWLNRDPAAEMRAHPIATLVIRGANDWNINHDDFAIIAAAATAPGSKSVELPGLNHIFMPSSDANSSASEMQPGSIAPILPDTIAAWIQSLT
jgi:dienelactone hydrolase